MIPNNKQFLFSILLAGTIITGCSKNYLNVNTDPNRVTDANVTAELIFPQAANGVGVRQASADFLFLDHWIGYISQNGGFAPQQNQITYNIDATFGNALWANQYHALFDLRQAETKGLATGDTALAGACIVMEAKLFQELVDLFGDIPYSQAFQDNNTTTPAYDNGQDIYNDLQKRLDTAVTYLSGTVTNAFSSVDIVNRGNLKLWVLFANTMKLRLLIRQSEISGFNPSADIAKITANGGVLGAGQSINVNPGYSNQTNKQNPYYSNFGYSVTGVQATSSDDANAYIVNLFTKNNDPRLSRFFYPVGFTGNSFVGCVFGAPQSTLPLAAQSSYFGPGLIGNASASGDVTAGPGSSQSQWIVPSFESMFWYAEAVARGWIAGNAQNAYAAAVNESFVWLGDPTAKSDAAAYLAGAGAWPGGSLQSQVQFIALQKYYSLTAIDPLEAYSDLRRLNMLTDNTYISIAPGRLSSTLPVRLLYPSTEFTTNTANVAKEGTINVFTSKLFWHTH